MGERWTVEMFDDDTFVRTVRAKDRVDAMARAEAFAVKRETYSADVFCNGTRVAIYDATGAVYDNRDMA